MNDNFNNENFENESNDNLNEQSTFEQFNPYSDHPQYEKVENKPSFMDKHKNKVLVVCCLAIALGGGFAGGFVANNFNKQDGVVFYQGVTNKVTNTSNSNSASIKEIAANASKSVVEIKTEAVSTGSFFQQAITSGAGSGVILSKDGYIVTNHHVIEDANKISVTTSDGKEYDAKLIGSDASSDLAVIKIEASDLTAATLGVSSDLAVGDLSVAIGNPLGELGGTVTSGIISALDREITIDNQTMHLLQTSAAINPGNSGGGLFNDQCQLIGIVNAKSSGDNIEGLGFAIPIDKAKPIIESIIEYGYVKGRPSLGVTLQSSAAYDESKASVYVSYVTKGSCADNAGLQVGDQIIKLADVEVTSITNLKDTLSLYKAGDTIEIVVLRNSELVTLKATLDDASDLDKQASSSQSQNQDDTNSGATIDPFEQFFGN